MSDSYVIVAGLGRCGTSLVMGMLHAAGIPCIGTPPDFEDMRTAWRIDPAWLAGRPGHAVKVLDPHRVWPPAGIDAEVIWLDRDPTEQARSQIKLVQSGGFPITATRNRMRGLVSVIERDRRQGRKLLHGLPMLTLTFEDILAEPLKAATAIASFLAPRRPGLDADRMADQVVSRGPECQPTLAIEERLLQAARA